VQYQPFYFEYGISTLEMVCTILKSVIKIFKHKLYSEKWRRGLLVKPRRRWKYNIKSVLENWDRRVWNGFSSG